MRAPRAGRLSVADHGPGKVARDVGVIVLLSALGAYAALMVLVSVLVRP